MKVFSISDLHLSLQEGKTMDQFGVQWERHSEKIAENWRAAVSEEDLVLLPGDLSWAMYVKDAAADMAFIEALPGRKVLLKGNHDYWWTSLAKVQSAFPKMQFLQNSCVVVEDYVICGSRGWLCPRDTYFTPHDQKLYEREMTRLRLSLEAAEKSGRKMIGMLHFPPFNDKSEPSGFVSLFQEFGVKQVIYGHLHGKESFAHVVTGKRNGIHYHLVSADYLDFAPKLIISDGDSSLDG